jgi:haloalkane dehalogenase
MKQAYLNINNSNIFYVTHGTGDPVLFLHGIPTSSFLWRNITPFLATKFKCIAPDLIGMGKSDKPDIEYSIREQVDYLTKFIETLNIKNINLVVHGFGSIIGLEYAKNNPANIKSIVFYESHLKPIKFEQLSLPLKQTAYKLKNMDNLEELILNSNFLVDLFLNSGTLNKLPEIIKNNYYNCYKTSADRKVLLSYISSILNINQKNEINNSIVNYSDYLIKSNTPKFLLYSSPGMLTTIELIQWAKENLNNLTISNLGQGLHFAQETSPFEFADALLNWYSAKS